MNVNVTQIARSIENVKKKHNEIILRDIVLIAIHTDTPHRANFKCWQNENS